MHMHMGETPLTTPAPSTPPQASSMLENIVKAAGSVLQIVNQQKLADTNLKRAKEGLPAIELSQLPGAVPTAAVQVGVEANTQKLLMLGGAGLLAFLLLKNKRR